MIVSVALPIPIQKTFSYSVPIHLESLIKPYMRVTVPFHNRVLKGYVIDFIDKSDHSLKDILDVLDLFPLLCEPITSLCQWTSRYYNAPLGQVLKYATPLNLSIEQYLILRSKNIQVAHLDGLQLKKALKLIPKEEVIKLHRENMIDFMDTFSHKPLSSSTSKQSHPKKHGKTLFIGGIDERIEYYLQLISKHVMRMENVIVLLPDYYASGKHFHSIISDVFKDSVYWYGSPEKTKARNEAFFKAQNNRGIIILGNKSAAFLTVNNNGLIIVEKDEADEHRNEEGFRFNARVIAQKRAELEDIPIVFGSAAPSFEVYKDALEGKCTVINRHMPLKDKRIDIIKKRRLSEPGGLPEEFVGIIEDGLKTHENVAIFTPRRLYASHLYCLDCKKPFLCDLCGGYLGYQKKENALVCTSCNKNIIYADKCPACGSGFIRFSQTGVEYLEEKLKEYFSQNCIVKIAAETLEDVLKSGVFTSKKQLMKPNQATNDADLTHLQPTIIVGTQTLTKLYGLKAGLLILFGWEQMIRFSGYRALEKMFQTLLNLADTLRPDHICFFMDEKKAIDIEQFIDLSLFYKNELHKRKFAEYPPYSRMLLITAEKQNEQATKRLINKIQDLFEKNGYKNNITGTFIERRLNWYQFKMIIKLPENSYLPEKLLDVYSFPNVRIEPDPHSV